MLTPLKYRIPAPPTPTKFPLKSPRGASLVTRVWPVKKPKALCLIVHGGGWHSGYFGDLTSVLTKEGIFCASYDQVNCGYSDPEPDSPDSGAMHIHSFDCLVEDVVAAIEWMQKEADNNTTAPVFLFGESFGALQVIATAFDQDRYKVKIAGVISSGGLLQLGDQFLPPWPVVSFMLFLSKYYPKLIMPATDFESTFDDAFGDKDWAKTARADPKVRTEIKATLGSLGATLGAGTELRSKAKDFPVKFYAVHGKDDVLTPCAAMEEFVDNIGPSRATIDVIETEGHQLLQDKPEVVKEMLNKIKNWILKTLKEP